MILVAVWVREIQYNFETVEMEPVSIDKESVITVCGKDEVLVFNALDYLLFGLFFEQLLLTVSFSN